MEKRNKAELIRIFKYAFASGTSFILDLMLFTFFAWCLKDVVNVMAARVFFATAAARVLSSAYNYLMNSRVVFQKKGTREIIGYFILVVVQMLVSAGLVSVAKTIFHEQNLTIIKLFIDVAIFIVNYIVQKKIIFRSDTANK